MTIIIERYFMKNGNQLTTIILSTLVKRKFYESDMNR